MNDPRKGDENNSEDQQPATQDQALDTNEDQVESLADDIENERIESENLEQVSEETENQPQVATANKGSSGKGLAGTALITSLLALGGSGYNWYNAQNQTVTGQAVQQASPAVDYSAQISDLQTQIKSLSESQQLLPMPAPEQQDESQVDEPLQTEVDSADGAAEAEPTTKSSQTQETMQAQTLLVEEPATEEADVEAEVEAEVEASTPDASDSTTLDSADAGTNTAVESDPIGFDASNGEIKQLAKQEMNALLAHTKKRFVVQEVGQLLTIGEQRLGLANDVEGAVAAFTLADKRLFSLDDPLTEPLQQSLVDNISALNAVVVVNKTELTEKLGALVKEMDNLPFKPVQSLLDQPETDANTEPTASNDSAAQEPASIRNDVLYLEQVDSAAQEPASAQTDTDLSLKNAGNIFKKYSVKVANKLGQIGEGFADDLKSMVRVERTGALDDIVLAPEQQYFVRENIKLMLGGAQRAVLQSNTGVFKQNLDQAQALISEHFALDDKAVQNAQSNISALLQLNLQPELPDLGDSSELLKAISDKLSAQ